MTMATNINAHQLQSTLWTELLRITQLRGYDQGPRSLYAALSEMRQYGTLIVRLPSGKFALRPIIGEGSSPRGDGIGWVSQEAYDALKTKLLKPHHPQLLECLTSLYCGAIADAEQTAKMEEALKQHGFVRMRSAALNDEIICVARDDKAGHKATDSARGMGGMVVYLLREIENLRLCPPTPDELIQIHEVKKLFAGSVVMG